MFKSKVLSKKDFDALSGKAGNYDKIVAAIVERNPSLQADDVTFETIQELMNNDSDDADPELQSKFDSLQGKFDTLKSNYETLTTENEELKEQVKNLQGSAAEEPAAAKSDSEVTGKPVSIADFANKHQGNTAAILEECKKEGII